MEENQNKSGLNSLYLVGALVLIAVFGGGYFFLSQSMKKETNQVAQEVEPTVTPLVAGAEIEEITMDAGSFYYAPNEIRVKEGQKVRIVLSSKDMMHDFNIDELEVKIPITKSGETNSVEFVATKKGTYEYYCSVGQHRANGQVGKLIVE